MRIKRFHTHAANKPMKSIQLAIEKVPPSSVFRFLTVLWSSSQCLVAKQTSKRLIHHLRLKTRFLPSRSLKKRRKKQKASQERSKTSVASRKTACDCVKFLMESKENMVSGNDSAYKSTPLSVKISDLVPKTSQLLVVVFNSCPTGHAQCVPL